MPYHKWVYNVLNIFFSYENDEIFQHTSNERHKCTKS